MTHRQIAPAWATAIDDFSAAQRVASLATATIQLRREQLQLLARSTELGPWEVQLEDLVSWLSERNWSQERRRSVRTTLRRFYFWAVNAHRIADSPAEGLPSVRAMRPSPRPTPDAVVRRARLAADARSLLMLRLAGECGLRRAEVAQIHSRDLEQDLGGWTLQVHGKGGKIRPVPLPMSIAEVLLKLPPGYAFPGNDGGHLSARWVGTLIARLLDGYGMHSLRHRFATLAYQTDHDTFTLQAVLGHASPETTRRYVQVPSDAARRMVELVSQQQNGAA